MPYHLNLQPLKFSLDFPRVFADALKCQPQVAEDGGIELHENHGGVGVTVFPTQMLHLLLMAQQKLPIGVQDFPELISGSYQYVDKTAYYHRLITQGKYYFLSRPRRFGKSLLVTTLAAIFAGRRELFNGLWIHDKIDWEPRPVILLDFGGISKRAEDLTEGIRLALNDIAAEQGLTLTEGTNAGQLQQLIRLMARERQVAILVDEYDKPLVDNIEDPELVNKNRQVLKDMYSIVKSNDKHIAFFLLTGVTKFSHVSIFSDLNHLNDISLDAHYSQMLGYTLEEIRQYFPEYLETLKSTWAETYGDVEAAMKSWYNGYSWDGRNLVFNPFSILNLFSKNEFGEYWFATGTPTFLVKLIRSRNLGIFDFKRSMVPLSSLGKFDVPSLEIDALLFQTGYLTIKEKDNLAQAVTLDFPNREVANAFSIHLLTEFAEKGFVETNTLVMRMGAHLRVGEVDAFMESLFTLFAGIAFKIQPAGRSGIENHERYYHTMFYLVLILLGYDIDAEVHTNIGQIDAVVTTAQYIYVIEFKLGDPAIALAQIKAKKYHQKFLQSGKKIVLVGIGFDVEERNVGGWMVEEV